MLLCPGTPLNRFDRRPVKKERSLTPSITCVERSKRFSAQRQRGQGLAMPSNQEQPTGISPTLGLLHLMIDLEVLSAELQVAEEAIGRPSWAYRESVTDRLTRVGVTTQKIEDFSAWEGTISGLTSITSRNEAHLAKIAAAEKAGLIVLTCLIGELRQRNQQKRATGTLTSHLAA